MAMAVGAVPVSDRQPKKTVVECLAAGRKIPHRKFVTDGKQTTFSRGRVCYVAGAG